MKLLVTGGSGFVGRTLCAAAAGRGWEVVAVSRQRSPYGRWFQADLSQPLNLDFRPDVVVHAAARSSPWGSSAQFQKQNVDATRHVLDYCRRAGLPRLVYISTSAVLYRNEHQLGMDESTPAPDRFLNEYARTKFEAEKWVRGYEGSHVTLRPRAVFGPGDTVVFPRILRAAREGKFPLIESKEPVWADLIYVDTLVDYIFRAAASTRGGLYHLSNNEPIAIVAFLQNLFERLGLPAPKRRIRVERAQRAAAVIETIYRFLPFLGEPPITRFGVSVFAYSKTMDVRKSLADFGPPSVALEDGVARFVEWQRLHLW